MLCTIISNIFQFISYLIKHHSLNTYPFTTIVSNSHFILYFTSFYHTCYSIALPFSNHYHLKALSRVYCLLPLLMWLGFKHVDSNYLIFISNPISHTMYNVQYTIFYFITMQFNTLSLIIIQFKFTSHEIVSKE